MATGRSTILATSSRTDRETEPVGDGKDRMDFKGLRAGVQGAKEAGGEELEGRCMAPSDGASQVEARTPPAMERNLFLSALANGKLEVTNKRQLHTGAHSPNFVVAVRLLRDI